MHLARVLPSVCAVALLAGAAHAQIVLVEPGHKLSVVANSTAPTDPSQTLMETLTPNAEIESICLDPATGDIFVQLIEPPGLPISLTSHIYKITPAGVTTPLSLFTGFGINERGTDLQFDTATGLLVTQDQNAGVIATVHPVTGAIGTYSLVTPPVFDPGGSTFGLDFSTGAGGSDVPPGDMVFTSDLAAAGIHSAFFGGLGSAVHVTGAVTGPADDMVIQPDGDWIWVGDSGAGIFNYSPIPPHPGVFTGLDVAAMFGAAGLPFGCGTRAAVCDTTGNTFVSWSCVPGANGIFRLDEPLTTSTLILTAGLTTGAEGIHDLELGPARLPFGTGQSIYFTVHNTVTGGEEVWEVTTLGCCSTTASAIPAIGLGSNAPFSIAEFPLANLPTVGNAGYAEAIDDPFNACAITPGSPTLLLVTLFPTSVVLPGFGCTPGGPGEFLADIFTPGSLVTVTGPVIWPGPGAVAVHPLPVPANIALCGLPVFTQGLWIDGLRTILSEGLFLVLGS